MYRLRVGDRAARFTHVAPSIWGGRGIPRIFTDAAALLFGDATRESLAALRPRPAPRFIPGIDPSSYSKKATVALTRVGRPLYSRPALLAFWVGGKFRARTIRRDEYLALSAQTRSPNRELSATEFRHPSALPISTDVYIGDMQPRQGLAT